jgi:TfoX/Sxy family transcriptional regulator of competence genes
MAYNLKLAERIRAQLEGIPFVEKNMFGGVGFLIGGNLACGVNKDNLIVRIDPEKQVTLLRKPHAKPFDLTGKPMKGWLVVEGACVKTEKQLRAWIKEGVEFASTLPPK